MAKPADDSWSGYSPTATNLDETTHGSGTTTERNAITSWPAARPFFDTDLHDYFYNSHASAPSSVTWSTITPVPVGSVVMFVGTEAEIPTGWFVCDGQAISRTTYAALFALIDEKYGNGDGSTTFNVPDFQGSNRFPRGATNDAGRGGTGGSSTHTLTESEMPAHIHSPYSWNWRFYCTNNNKCLKFSWSSTNKFYWWWFISRKQTTIS